MVFVVKICFSAAQRFFKTVPLAFKERQSYVTLEHKTSQFYEIEIYASSESCINKISIDVWFVMIG